MKFAIALLLVAAGAAHAEPGLVWHAPAECPGQQALQLRIDARAAAGTRLDETVTVEVAHAGATFSARVAIGDAPARTLAAPSCDELADAVAVIVARLAREVPAPSPMPSIAPPAQLPPRAAPPAARSWRIGVRAGGIAAEGVLPGTGLGVAGAIHGEWGPAYAAIGGVQWATATRGVTAPTSTVDHLDIGLQAATAQVGWVVPRWPARVFAAGELGTMSGAGMKTGDGRWLAVGGGAAAWWQAVPHIRVIAEVTAEVARDRVKFVISNGDVGYEARDWSVRVAAGLEIDVP